VSLRVAVIVLIAVAGCARVKPHQRETLAHPAMQQPAWPEVEADDQHTFEVREGSGGATGTAGGGCGCD
jgi:hypothetical protein